LTVVDISVAAAGTWAVALPCKNTRVLLLAAVTPPPKLVRPNRLVLPLAKGEGTTGLRIVAPPSYGLAPVVHNASGQNAAASPTPRFARWRRNRCLGQSRTPGLPGLSSK